MSGTCISTTRDPATERIQNRFFLRCVVPFTGKFRKFYRFAICLLKFLLMPARILFPILLTDFVRVHRAGFGLFLFVLHLEADLDRLFLSLGKQSANTASVRRIFAGREKERPWERGWVLKLSREKWRRFCCCWFHLR